MSGGIYSDHGPDRAARASESGQMSQMVGRTDGWVQEYPEHQTEKCPGWIRKCLEQGFP
jgi:hypothetical protein